MSAHPYWDFPGPNAHLDPRGLAEQRAAQDQRARDIADQAAVRGSTKEAPRRRSARGHGQTTQGGPT